MEMELTISLAVKVDESGANLNEICAAVAETVRGELAVRVTEEVIEGLQDDIRDRLCTASGGGAKKGFGSHDGKEVLADDGGAGNRAKGETHDGVGASGERGGDEDELPARGRRDRGVGRGAGAQVECAPMGGGTRVTGERGEGDPDRDGRWDEVQEVARGAWRVENRHRAGKGPESASCGGLGRDELGGDRQGSAEDPQDGPGGRGAVEAVRRRRGARDRQASGVGGG